MASMLRKPTANGDPLEGKVVEISLLLPEWQVTALETVAHDSGLTAAEMVRQLLHAFITRLPSTHPDAMMASLGNGKPY